MCVQLYPEVLVLTEGDLNDIPALVEKLAAAPYFLRINAAANSLRRDVRQLFIKTSSLTELDLELRQRHTPLR